VPFCRLARDDASPSPTPPCRPQALPLRLHRRRIGPAGAAAASTRLGQRPRWPARGASSARHHRCHPLCRPQRLRLAGPALTSRPGAPWTGSTGAGTPARRYDSPSSSTAPTASSRTSSDSGRVPPRPGGRGGSRWARRQASQAKTSTGNDEPGQYDTGTRPPGRRAKPCLWSGPFLHRAPGITGTLNDVPGLAAHRDRRRPDDGRSSVSGLALDGASSQIGSTVASGGCDAVHDHAGRQPGSDLRKEAALCLPRGADAGASTTGTTRRCSRSFGFPGRLGLGRRSATGYRDS
jgi:hypothetical protein